MPPRKPPVIDVELHHDADPVLIANCARQLNQTCKRISLRSLPRHGYSGSQLYVAFFANGSKGRPYVAKLNSLREVDSERKAADRVQVYFDNAHVQASDTDSDSKRGALVYPLIGTEPDGTEVRTLDDEIKAGVGSIQQDKRLARLVGKLYDHQCTPAHKTERKERLLDREHRRYLRASSRDRAGMRLAALYGSRETSKKRDVLQAEVRDPRFAIKELGATKLELSVADAVHGDLHGSNVLIDATGGPQLIDFAWGQTSTHVLKDYVLLECSVRFFLFPDHMDFEVQRKIDLALLREDGPERMGKMRPGTHLRDYYRRLGCVLGATREAARRAAGDDFDFDEYLACQLWVLYGLLSYDTYRFHAAARALGMISNRLLDRYA